MENATVEKERSEETVKEREREREREEEEKGYGVEGEERQEVKRA